MNEIDVDYFLDICEKRIIREKDKALMTEDYLRGYLMAINDIICDLGDDVYEAWVKKTKEGKE
ncbi:MAG: hypothetical protein KAR64_00390 [Thermoplasmatales archaeon]|nr:hypothetical protein [Thermoplasmatales archaeon]